MADNEGHGGECVDALVGRQFTHYQIIGTLGRGGMGAVYEALDTRLDRTVALKVLLNETLHDPGHRQRFQREARAAAALSHPNICKIFDVGEVDGVPFFVMELVEGTSLSDRLSRESVTVSEIGMIGAQIAEALAAAHARGIIHRDIKPGNIFLSANGDVVVLDFGLAKIDSAGLEGGNLEPEAPALTSIGQIVGTVAYMSPEQAVGKEIPTGSDIFSLGVLLYKMATGVFPFKGSSKMEILMAIVKGEPIAPLALAPGIPGKLDGLIMRMLQNSPSMRPTAGEAAGILREVAGGVESGGPTISTVTARDNRPVVGRGGELAALHAGFEQVRSSGGHLLCLTGEPGIGKSTLVETFMKEVAEGGVLGMVAFGRCSERLVGAEAFLPMLEALERLLRDVNGVARQMQQLAPSWYAQIVSSSGLGADGRPAEVVVPASQEQMTRELVQFFQELTRLRPGILFIDDLHWADVSTTDLLAYLASKFDALQLLILVTYRATDIALAEHPFLKIKMGLEAKGLAREIPLSFLGYEDLGGYLDLEFPGHCFPSEFVDLIHAKTEGNPLFMVDLVHYLRDRGALASQDGRWELTVPLSDIEEDLPASVRSLIQLKIDRLDRGDQKLLAVASVQGRQFDSAVLATALKADPAEIEERLELIENVHAFIAFEDEEEFPDGTLTVRCSFVHALYQNAFYGSLRPTRRASYSASVAAALRGFYGGRSGDVASELAFLYESARDFAHATEFFAIAARHNMSIHAYREAAQLAERGLGHLARLPEEERVNEQELQLQSTLGPALMATRGFSVPEVGVALERARELCLHGTDHRQRFSVSRGLWQYYLVRGELSKARDISRELIEVADMGAEHSMVSEACRTLGESSMFMGHFEEARDVFERGIVSFDETSVFTSESPLVLCLYDSAWTHWVLGNPEVAQERTIRSEAAAAETGDPFSIAVAKFGSIILDVLLRKFESVAAQGAELLALAQEGGFKFLECVALIPHGWGLTMLGDHERGLEETAKGIEMAEAANASLIMPLFKGLLADAQQHAGRHQEALATLESARGIAIQSEELWGLAELKRLEGVSLLALATDDPSAGEQCFREGLELARSQRARSWELRIAMDLAHLLVSRGETANALDLLRPIYSSYTEGLETKDLIKARMLLAELS